MNSLHHSRGGNSSAFFAQLKPSWDQLESKLPSASESQLTMCSTRTLQCSSSLGLIWCFGEDAWHRTQKGTTWEGPGGLQKIQIWIWDDLGWFSIFVPFGLGGQSSPNFLGFCSKDPRDHMNMKLLQMMFFWNLPLSGALNQDVCCSQYFWYAQRTWTLYKEFSRGYNATPV